jgi:hypothetical protein
MFYAQLRENMSECCLARWSLKTIFLSSCLTMMLAHCKVERHTFEALILEPIYILVFDIDRN